MMAGRSIKVMSRGTAQPLPQNYSLESGSIPGHRSDLKAYWTKISV